MGCGCAPDAAPATWHGDEAFGVEDRADIEAGASWIAEHVDRPAPVIVWDLPHDAPEAPNTIGLTTAGETEGHVSEGCYCDGRIALSAPPTYPAGSVWAQKGTVSFLEALSAHEFGHAFGLGHLPDGEKGTMGAFDYWRAREWTDADQTNCAGAGLCR